MVDIAIAEFNAGVREEPLGSNRGTRVCEYLKAGKAGCPNPWCAGFVSWVFAEAGRPLGECAAAGVATIKSCAERKGWPVSNSLRSPSPGDIIIFRADDGYPNNDHAGIVIKVTSGSIITIEGNSSDRVSRNSYPLTQPRVGIISLP